MNFSCMFLVCYYLSSIDCRQIFLSKTEHFTLWHELFGHLYYVLLLPSSSCNKLCYNFAYFHAYQDRPKALFTMILHTKSCLLNYVAVSAVYMHTLPICLHSMFVYCVHMFLLVFVVSIYIFAICLQSFAIESGIWKKNGSL